MQWQFYLVHFHRDPPELHRDYDVRARVKLLASPPSVMMRRAAVALSSTRNFGRKSGRWARMMFEVGWMGGIKAPDFITTCTQKSHQAKVLHCLWLVDGHSGPSLRALRCAHYSVGMCIGPADGWRSMG